MTIENILVVGAGCAVGLEVVQALRAQNINVTASYRTHRQSIIDKLLSLGAEIVQLDLDNEKALKLCLNDKSGAIFIPILSASQSAAQYLKSHQRAVFFSSNNVSVDPENEIYRQLRDAELKTQDFAPHSVILRPTMIYGYPGDGNLSRLMNVMRRLPVIPMPGTGKALQQPVYYKDLAKIAIRTLFGDENCRSILAVAGPVAVSQRQLYTEVMRAFGANRKIISIPTHSLTYPIHRLERLGLRLPLSSAQLARSEINKLPSGDNLLLGGTSLSEGLESLAQALDAMPYGT